MKIRWIKILCLFVCVLMIAGCFAACGNKDNPNQDPNTNDGNNTSEPGVEYETDSNGYVKDSITQTFGGANINILSWTEKRDYLFPEQNSASDNILSSVYIRNIDVSKRLDVFFNVTTVKGEWSSYDTFITQANLAGDLGYDLICSYSLWPSVLATKGVLYNLNNLAYPELNMPWWPDTITEWEQYGSLFFIADNSSIPVIKSMELCFANLPLIRNEGLDDPLQMVIDGTWTVEVLIEYATQFGNSFDSRSIYGIVVDEYSRMDAFFYGAGFHCTLNNNDGEAELALTTASSVDRVTSYINQLGQMFQYEWAEIFQNSIEPMKNNSTAFEVAYMDYLTKMTDTNYAPLPMPKLDSTQKDYCTVSHNGFDVWCIPDSAANAEVSAVIIEAFASSDYRTLAPLFYENNLKLRYSTSEIGAEVFDIIRNSVIYDFGRISAKTLGVTESPFRLCFWDASLQTTAFSNRYSEYLDKNKGTYEANLITLLEAYRRYKNR